MSCTSNLIELLKLERIFSIAYKAAYAPRHSRGQVKRCRRLRVPRYLQRIVLTPSPKFFERKLPLDRFFSTSLRLSLLLQQPNLSHRFALSFCRRSIACFFVVSFRYPGILICWEKLAPFSGRSVEKSLHFELHIFPRLLRFL